MTCSACSNHVEKSVSAVNGVCNVQVNLLANNMVVEYDDTTSPKEIILAVKSGGYGAYLPGTESLNKTFDETASMKKRLLLSLCFLVPLMYVSMGHMWNLPGTSVLNSDHYIILFGLIQLLLTLPVIVINFKFFSGGLKALIKGSPNMDTLVATGSAASLIYGVYSLFCIFTFSKAGEFATAHQFAGNLYFESAAMILTLITAGKFLEAKAKKRTFNTINALMKLAPQTAHIIRNGKEITVSADEVAVGDSVVVRTGESIPCDGIITQGEGTADESTITGESLPVNKSFGDAVTGATILTSGFVTFTAQHIGNDTMFAKIIQRVKDASATKAPIARFADNVVLPTPPLNEVTI